MGNTTVVCVRIRTRVHACGKPIYAETECDYDCGGMGVLDLLLPNLIRIAGPEFNYNTWLGHNAIPVYTLTLFSCIYVCRMSSTRVVEVQKFTVAGFDSLVEPSQVYGSLSTVCDITFSLQPQYDD